jgi:AbiU2
MTGAEMEARNVHMMGQELGKQYSVLFHEVTALHLYWKEFLELFGTNDKRIERLNLSAPGFFRMLQEQQFETNMLHIARLTDSSKSVGKDNLTIRNLPDLVTDPQLKRDLVALVDEARKKTEFCRDWRHRRFAHHDLLLAVQDGKAAPLKVASKESVNAALGALADVLNAIERYYFKGGCDFDAIAAREGVATLLFTLGFGVKARADMEAKIASGKFDELDTPESI